MSTRSEVLRAIKRYQAKHGWAPSIEEIGEAVGLSSKSTVQAHLKNLERLGFIERGKYPRQIRLTGEEKS